MSRHKSLLLLVLAVAFLLRCVAAFGLEHYLENSTQRRFLIAGDATGYWELGHRIANFEEYAVHEPPRRVMRTPGFPAILAIAIKFAGDSTLAARLLLAAVGTAACGLVYLLGLLLIDERVGLLAAALTALAPTMIGFSVLILSETLFAATLVTSLVAVAFLMRNHSEKNKTPSLWIGLATGFAFAVTCYVRPSWMLATPVFAAAVVWLSADRKCGFLQATAILLGFCVAWSPWVIRNHQVTGRLVTTTLWVGPSLYDGLNANATGDSNMTFFEEDNTLARMSEFEMDQHYRKAAVAFAKENPIRTMELAALKLIRYWKPWPNADQFNKWWQKAAVAAFFVPLVALAAWGIWAKRRRPLVLLLTVFPIVYFSAIHSVFVGSLRYRLPAEYPMCIVAAVGICELIRRRQPKTSTTSSMTG